MKGYISMLAWSFLPPQITASILPTLSSTFPSLLPASPQGSPAWRQNYRKVLTAVVLLALAYNFITSAAGEKDWYDVLGVGPRVGDDELKKAYRKLSRVYHPDRTGPNAGPEVESRFIAIRLAYETLSDPVKRFAYDRFGPRSTSWNKVESMRDYIQAGAQSSSGFYMGALGLMTVLALLGRAQQGAYWRNALLGVLLIWETTLILAPTPTASASANVEPLLLPLPVPIANMLAFIIPRSILQRPAYQHIALLHRLFADASIAISQLAAEWSPRVDKTQAAMQLAHQLNGEAVQGLAEVITPVLSATNDPAALERNLLNRMQTIFLDRAMQSHPDIRPHWTAVMHRETEHVHGPGCTHADTAGTRQTHGASKDTLAVAANTPLPPSRPTTPLPTIGADGVDGADGDVKDQGPRRRSARLNTPA